MTGYLLITDHGESVPELHGFNAGNSNTAAMERAANMLASPPCRYAVLRPRVLRMIVDKDGFVGWRLIGSVFWPHSPSLSYRMEQGFKRWLKYYVHDNC